MRRFPQNGRVRIINANFTRVFYASAISFLGDYVFDTTLILWISTRLLPGKDYAPAAVSGVLVAVAAAIIVVGPVAGVFVDRWDKRRTMMVSDLIRAVLVALLGVVATLPVGALPAGASLALIYGVVFLSTAGSQFFWPARFAILADITPGDAERARAAGLMQSLGYTAAVVGPPLAAPLLFQTGPYWALYLNAASFVLSYLLIRLVRIAPAAAPSAPEEPGPASRSGFFGEFRSGIAFAAGQAPVRALMVSITTVTLGAGALNALMVFFVTDNLHSKPDLFGTMGMGEGIGAIAGTLTAGWICARLGDVRVFCYGLAIGGIGILAFARMDHLVTAIIVLAVLGIPLGAVNVALTPILLRAVPRELLGRVAGILTPVQYAASMVAALVAGWLASTALHDFHMTFGPVTLGRIDTIFTAAGLIVLIGAVYAAVQPNPWARRRHPYPRWSTEVPVP
jgi:MFS family permease